MLKNPFGGWRLKSLIGATVLVAGLVVVAGSGGRSAHAIDDDPQPPDPPEMGSTPTPAPAPKFKVELTFEHVVLDNTDDGVGDPVVEAFGRLTANGGGTSFRRMFGTNDWDHSASGCPSGVNWWTGGWQAKCFRGMGLDALIGQARPFADVPLCNYVAGSGDCTDGFGSNRNKAIFNISAGQTVSWNVTMKDYDLTSANDTLCNVGHSFGPFSAAQLQNVGASWFQVRNQADNGDASCSVRVTLKRVS
jgi:hypothetical protein